MKGARDCFHLKVKKRDLAFYLLRFHGRAPIFTP